MKINVNQGTQGVLDFDVVKEMWPSQDQFPINWKSLNRKVINVIEKDVINSKEFLIITGFTSLGYIIDFTTKKINFNKIDRIRVVLGFEPDRIHRRKSWEKVVFDKIIKEYWYQEGISIFKSGAVIQTINNIQEGKISFKFLDKLHAKIYVTDSSGIIGSSNFSQNGLYNQLEANIRIPKTIDSSSVHFEQYEGIKNLANNYWENAIDYNNKIVELLKKLLIVVGWEEALSRAISELLEGNNLNDFPELVDNLKNIKLWPSQRMALGQALNILKEYGTVLIAEPTGSGKTKLISSLRLALTHWYVETRKRLKLETLIICPKIVENNWQKESCELSFISESHLSMGLLSKSTPLKDRHISYKIQNADLLIIDEAHNFLATDSNRSKKVTDNKADCIILSTATPINKKANDLLRLIELLDVDNLSDEDLKQYIGLRKLWSITEHKQLEELSRYIWKFTVRRTKKQLRELISTEPESYLNKEGEPCKYPTQNCLVYSLEEPESDLRIASQINSLAEKLKGVSRIRNIKRPIHVPEEKYQNTFDNLVKGARALSIFSIQAAMRSSKVALYEHLFGTQQAAAKFSLEKPQKQDSGNVINKIETYKNSLPKIQYPEGSVLIPSWLTNIDEYKITCEEEIEIYKKIGELAEMLSENREQKKVKQLLKILKEHDIILAFDSTIITLHYLHKLITQNFSVECYTLTGGNKDKSIIEKFQLGSISKNLIGLCSDSMSEGVNMQQASALVLLDMPSVLRIAEQRVGRIERLDSPHKSIDVYWPKDADAFALKADKKLIKTFNIAEALIGSNLEIPEVLNPLSVDTVIDEYNKLQDESLIWDGIKDAYSYVYSLYEGENPIIKKEDYLSLRDVKASIKCKLSLGISNEPWIFLAVKSTKSRPSKWLFIDSSLNICSDLEEICQKLRKNLNIVDKWEKEWNDHAQKEFDKYFLLLKNKEIELLPPKKKRTLETAKIILDKLLKRERNKPTEEKSTKRVDLIIRLKDTLKNNKNEEGLNIDYYSYSENWYLALKPALREKKDANKDKKRIISLKDLAKDQKIDLSTSILEKLNKEIPIQEDIWTQVAACILAIPEKAN